MNLLKKKIIDLTHPITEGMPVWPGDPHIFIENVSDFQNDGYYMNNISMSEHTGTHIGAPLHFYPFGSDVTQIPLQNLIMKALKINLTKHTSKNPDYLLTINDIIKWEEENTRITSQYLMLIETGWSQYWGKPKVYFGFKHEEMHFPGISLDAIVFLAEQRKIKTIGIDSAGIDGGLSLDFIVNKYCSDNNIYHLENLTNLSQVKETGALIFIGALPIRGGSGSPCRILALQ